MNNKQQTTCMQAETLPAAHVLVVTLVVVFVALLNMLVVILIHLLLKQSLASTHVASTPHLGQELPPQSTADSFPFLMLSPHVAAAQQSKFHHDSTEPRSVW